MKANIKELVSQMTLEEKASMCSGTGFWYTQAIERLGIPGVMVSDGPHGLRKQDEAADHLGINESIKAVCFPAACATASSFDTDLMYHMGQTLGKECQAESVSVLLGPAVNIKRSPLCGRNFEYVSEDPFLAGKMSASYISGVQSQNIGTSIKHFAANNQEYRRMTSSSNIDERTLREIYLTAFEIAVKEVQPWTVMCSYNQLNGVFASENHKLLTEILRDEWGFNGYVVSDWGAVNNRVEGILAGMDLEMPDSHGANDPLIIEAVHNGTLPEEVLDTTVERILAKVFTYVENKTGGTFQLEADHNTSCQVERESMVLLKNEGILPLKENQKIAYIGEFAQKPRFQGGGSSHINSFKVSSATDCIPEGTAVTYAQGYITSADRTDDALLAEAVMQARQADVAVIFAGLPDSFESEGYDRTHLNLPVCQDELIRQVCKVQPNTVVVLHNGSPVIMPWLSSVKGVLEAYLGGQAVGQAVTDVLYGKVNPCGKLAETFPLRLADTPSYLNFPGNGTDVDYQEGVFVGYRWYDSREMDVLFPFGYGLSYTTYEYSNLTVDKTSFTDEDTVTVSVDVTNTGSMAGKEIVQLYVSDHTGSAVRPLKELKGFSKIALQPGETKTVVMELNKRSFAWYKESINDWFSAPGKYTILIGKSSRDIVLTQTVTITRSAHSAFVVTANTTCGELMRIESTRKLLEQYTTAFTGAASPDEEDSTSAEAITAEMQNSMLDNMPLRGMRSFSGIDSATLNQLIEKLNQALLQE